jgi:hypothetical protein
MVSLEALAVAPESTSENRDEHEATHLAKMDMFRGSKGTSVLAKRLNNKKVAADAKEKSAVEKKGRAAADTEGTSTTDTEGTDTEGSRPESDGMSDASQEVNESKFAPAIDFESIPEAGDMHFDVNFMSPDPFDFQPSVRFRPTFFERDNYVPTEVWPTVDAAWQPEQMPMMQPMGPPELEPLAAQRMPMQSMAAHAPQPMSAAAFQQMAMQTMQQMHAPTASCAPNSSPGGPLYVPVPVPVPFQMPFSMPQPAPQPALAPQSVPVPAGFKLVRIPERAPEMIAEEKSATKSAIADPANTDRKIFVGGLNPITTGQALSKYFTQFGPVLDAKVIREGDRSKGFGFVQFRDSIPPAVLEQRSHIIDQRRCGVGPAFHDGAR